MLNLSLLIGGKRLLFHHILQGMLLNLLCVTEIDQVRVLLELLRLIEQLLLALLRLIQETHVRNQILLIWFDFNLSQALHLVPFLTLVQLSLCRAINQLIGILLLNAPVIVEGYFGSGSLCTNKILIVLLRLVTLICLELILVILFKGGSCLNLSSILLRQALVSQSNQIHSLLV